jgi:UDP-N-acetylglucosamine 2-epimerase
LRGETEWPETVEGGGNKVAGIAKAAVLTAVDDWEARLAKGRPDFSREANEQFGGGRAGDLIVERLIDFVAKR